MPSLSFGLCYLTKAYGELFRVGDPPRSKNAVGMLSPAFNRFAELLQMASDTKDTIHPQT